MRKNRVNLALKTARESERQYIVNEKAILYSMIAASTGATSNCGDEVLCEIA